MFNIEKKNHESYLYCKISKSVNAIALFQADIALFQADLSDKTEQFLVVWIS